MKLSQTIVPEIKKQTPFIRQGKREPFFSDKNKQPLSPARLQSRENEANEFAQKAVTNPAILESFLLHKNELRPNRKRDPHLVGLQDDFAGDVLPVGVAAVFKEEMGIDFSAVRLHTDDVGASISRQHNAAALTSGQHIFLNPDRFDPGTSAGLALLAHELFHTLVPATKNRSIEFQLKPITDPTDRNPQQQLALDRAVKIAQGEVGKVNSGVLNEDKTRVGWEFLLEYFKTTLGEDTIVQSPADYKPGKLLEDVIKYVKIIKIK